MMLSPWNWPNESLPKPLQLFLKVPINGGLQGFRMFLKEIGTVYIKGQGVETPGSQLPWNRAQRR